VRGSHLLGLAAALTLLAACAAPPSAPEASPPAIGMANPASVACVNQGGKTEIRDSAAGQYGVCVFSDGRQCEEWTLHREGRCVAPILAATPS
jgi:putative hemolysin